MRKSQFSSWVLACCLLPAMALAAPRTWRDNSGKFTLEAELVEADDEQVVLKTAQGRTVKVPRARLSEADRRHLETLDASTSDGPQADAEINAMLAQVCQQTKVPALTAAIVNSDGLVAFGVAGVRKRGTRSPATQRDLWHLGSDTKAMTAALVASLVEQGQLGWDTTLGEIFADDGIDIHPDLQGATVAQLLSHRAGLPANLELKEYLGDDVVALRRRALSELAKAPQSPPGETFSYSNLGYIIVGAIIEKRTGKSWEENIQKVVFAPLEMRSAGFGGLGTVGKVDQPWPHADDGKPVAGNGPKVDNPPVMGPAGRVHCSIQDWSRFIADVLRGVAGGEALLQPASYQRLTTPAGGADYALGWIVTERGWAGGQVLQHSGSNTMNYATVWIAPKRDLAFLACCNQGGDVAAAACDAAVTALISHPLAKER